MKDFGIIGHSELSAIAICSCTANISVVGNNYGDHVGFIGYSSGTLNVSFSDIQLKFKEIGSQVGLFGFVENGQCAFTNLSIGI